MMMMMLMVEFVGGSHIFFMREGVLECDLVWVVGGMVIVSASGRSRHSTYEASYLCGLKFCF